jgi:uncharacterized protein (DUF58 family)
VLTRSGWGALALAGLAFAAGRVFGLIELYVLGAGMLMILVTAVVSAMRKPPRLGARRIVEPLVVRAGESARVDVQVVNLGGRTSPVVQLWEPVGATGGALMNLAPLRRGERATAAYRLPTTRRGVLQVGPMQARRRDVLGLCSTSFVVPGSAELLVIPRHVPAPFGLSSSGGRLGEHLRMRALGQSGSEFHALREYVNGDDIRRISWKASARSQDLIVKETAVEGVRRTTIVVDIDADAHDEAGFERAMSITAGLVTGSVAVGLVTRVVSIDLDLRGPEVVGHALRWTAGAEPLAIVEGEMRPPMPSMRAGEGMGVLVLVTSSPASPRASEVRSGLSPDDTLVVIATRDAEGRDPFVVDATTEEAFQQSWARLVGAVSTRPSLANVGVVA